MWGVREWIQIITNSVRHVEWQQEEWSSQITIRAYFVTNKRQNIIEYRFRNKHTSIYTRTRSCNYYKRYVHRHFGWVSMNHIRVQYQYYVGTNYRQSRHHVPDRIDATMLANHKIHPHPIQSPSFWYWSPSHHHSHCPTIVWWTWPMFWFGSVCWQ